MPYTINRVVMPGLVGDVSANSVGASASDTIANDGTVYVEVTNSSAGVRTVTCTGIQACRFGTIHPATVTVPAGARRVIGPFPLARFGRTVTIALSDVTSVSLYVFSAGG